uniref:4'-phosphopantetheinyl transferase (Putative 4'-phosphopantetheinyl transferase)) n=1 Tax=Ganoderma boninense TaxID=34458 RepID=A0A5K1JYH3_9APHY|nr:4'-phosphopantetheinyl transferase (EC (Colibactin biosynthesis phosphopantetheinyl transferase ClbA) (Putative 4'-phosphopantetheinyl transferase) [Ganoderma boninense]
MIGYHTSYDRHLVGMAMTQGRKEDVVNIGIGIKEIVSPPGMSANDFAISLYHKSGFFPQLTPLEQSHIAPDLGEEVVMRRLCVLLALKQAYIKAIGQPMGFDWSRLEFNIPNKTATGDGRPLAGWEFRVWSSDLGFPLQETEGHHRQKYQCAVAFFRRTRETRFVWQTDAKDLESWVQFITLDQLLNVADKLVE